MRIKINFSCHKDGFDKPIQDYVNSFIHKLLGHNNVYHDSFSNYSISSLNGGVIVDGKITYPYGGYLYISSLDMDFLFKIKKALLKTNFQLCDMSPVSANIEDFYPMNEYDIIRTVNPILLKDGDNIITYKDENFIEVLLEKSKKKLLHNGIPYNKVETLNIEPFHFEKAKVKYAKVKNVINKSSHVMLCIKGDRDARYALYNLGLGKSTGCGFGNVDIIRKK